VRVPAVATSALDAGWVGGEAVPAEARTSPSIAPRDDRRRSKCFVRCRRCSALVPSLLFLCHSPTLRPWIAGRKRARLRDGVIVEGLWSPSLVPQMEKAYAKAKRKCACAFSALSAEESFSLRRGLDSI